MYIQRVCTESFTLLITSRSKLDTSHENSSPLYGYYAHSTLTHNLNATTLLQVLLPWAPAFSSIYTTRAWTKYNVTFVASCCKSVYILFCTVIVLPSVTHLCNQEPVRQFWQASKYVLQILIFRLCCFSIF